MWDGLLMEEERQEATFVLPLAIIETGNHIAQATKNHYECAQELVRIIG
ncbi:hypothetical protein SAMN05216169_10837 [Anoxybacillus pushchinoensis]|jgi:hypothetical protein|uniref:Uncharacterized protein n=1 Tax=Anoxybacillus pushchinoensis TaxID=150248 RepID=A0A1I0U4K5_9BACL|nr:hypothetical protein [Anoxybacillus pushchinoensis]SFA58991.1 hypothetical protein SAMN05216169_10837 [Anoxybacillus pushchinoensis]